MIADGINPKLIQQNINGNLKLKELGLFILPRDTNSFSDIDSGIIVYHLKKKYSVTNLNDFGFSRNFMKKFQNEIDKKKLKNIATLYNYMSSGSWPHTHFKCDNNNKNLKKSLKIQRDEFKKRYFETHDLIESKIHLPFAAGAKYLGPLSKYEKFRPKTNIKSILDKDPKAIFMKPFGNKVDLMKISEDKKLFEKHRPKRINENLTQNKNSHDLYDYEKTFFNLGYNKRILKKLFDNSKKRALSRCEVKDKHLLSIYALPNWKTFDDMMFKDKVNDKKKFLIGDIKFNCKSKNKKQKMNTTEIYLHHKALFGAFTGVVHWNNLELGAHKIVRRSPEVFNKGVVDFLNFFSIC